MQFRIESGVEDATAGTATVQSVYVLEIQRNSQTQFANTETHYIVQ